MPNSSLPLAFGKFLAQLLIAKKTQTPLNGSMQHLFPKAAFAVLIFFMSLMLYVTVHAYLRKSGNTGIDPGKIQLIRYHANNQPPKNTSP